MQPVISIIIPCYKTESTLNDTLQSVFKQVYTTWEAIIVNDGSPDNLEAVALKWVEKDSRFKYFKKDNGGLGSARNYGIKKSVGQYILPLDSDNKLKDDFVDNALKVFNSNENIGVVHGNAKFFGEKDGCWNVSKFNFEKLLIGNYIDACAIFKKALWCEVGGYDINMPHQGNEDWDFWLALGKKQINFYHLDQITFFYRVSKKSMINTFTEKMFFENREYIHKKYSENYFYFFKKYKRQSDIYDSEPLKASIFFMKKWIKSFM